MVAVRCAAVDFDFRTVECGYVVTVTGEFDALEIREVWDRIQAERPPTGFRFGVVDLGDREFPIFDSWELTPERFELLHPAARMVNATLQSGVRLAIVSPRRILDAVITDILALAEMSQLTPRDAGPDLRRFEAIEPALAWCRAGVGTADRTTVRE